MNPFQVSYKKNVGKNFMLIEAPDTRTDSDTKSFRIRMLHENIIPGLLNTQVQYVDDIPSYQYDITGMQSLQIMLDTTPLTYTVLCKIFLSIYNTMLSIENYLLLHDHILLSPEYVYLTADFSDIRLCYCPMKTDSIYESIRSFFDYLLKRVEHSDEKCVYLAYSMHRCCCDSDFNLEKLYTQLASVPEHTENSSYSNTTTPPKVTPVNDTTATVNLEHSNYDDVFLKRDNPSKLIKTCALTAGIFIAFLAATLLYTNDFFNTEFYFLLLISIAVIGIYNGYQLYRQYGKTKLETVAAANISMKGIPSDSSTVMLAAAADINSHKLIYTGNGDGDDITLTHYPFVIGKTESCSAVLKNSAISRLHAKLNILPVDDSEDIFIEDLNSTNGTLVNNMPLTPYEKYPITSGDYITFGHLTYIFR